MLEGSECPNWLCRDPTRRISKIHAIAYSSGPLRKTILNYKYEGRTGWSLIFGRLLVAWLDQYAQSEPLGLIVANPTYVGAGGAPFGHTELVVEAAAKEDVLGEWPFDIDEPRAILKVIATTKSAGHGAPAKRTAAAELRSALCILDIERVRGKKILIYDDVCTTGSQLDAVAGFLMDEGEAVEVEGIVLARAPWRPRS
jgi:predicted amidophosphoribosyltransferase